MAPTFPIVVPAKAGTQRLLRERHWVPAFAGTTETCRGVLLTR